MNKVDMTATVILVVFAILGGIGLYNDIQETRTVLENEIQTLRADLELESEKLLFLSLIGDAQDRCYAMHRKNPEFLYEKKGCDVTPEDLRKILGDEKYAAYGFPEMVEKDKELHPWIYEEESR